MEKGVFAPLYPSLVSNKFSRFDFLFPEKLAPRNQLSFSPWKLHPLSPLNLPMGAGATTPGAMEITATLQQLVATFEQHGPSEELLPLMQRAMIALKVKVCERSYRCGNNGVLLGGKRGEDLVMKMKRCSEIVRRMPCHWCDSSEEMWYSRRFSLQLIL